VERRAEAKENANRCRTCRTQGRESVSPAPERVRKAEASRQTSEVGAVCRKAARTVLCGGRPVMGIPTAIAGDGFGFSLPAARCRQSRPGDGPAVRAGVRRDRNELAAGHCQLSGPRAPFSGPARLERGSAIGEQSSSPTRAAAPRTRAAFHGRLS